MKTTKPMLEYLATCSKISLESFELARLNDRANLRKRIIELMDDLVEADIQARIAEWMLVHRRRQTATRRRAPRNSSSVPQNLALPLFPRDRSVDKNARDLPVLGPNPVLPALCEGIIETPGSLRPNTAHMAEKSRRIA